MIMHIWTIDNWEKFYHEKKVRSGLRLRFDLNIDPNLKRALKEFCQWIRHNYYFPMRIPVYFKSAKHIRALDGELVSATFFEPDSKYVEPYIKIAVGEYEDLLKTKSADDAISIVLRSLAHELTHYYQWINDLKLTSMGSERQAKQYADFIIDEYSCTREHP
jgi:hypothetical protein